MLLAGLTVILTVVWLLLAYVAVPLPVNDPLFAWLRRQWLFEGIAALACLGAISVLVARRRSRPVGAMPWWPVWGLWLLWAGLSLVWSIDRGLTLRQWLAFASYGLLAFVVWAQIRSPQDVVIWSRLLVLAAIVASLEGGFQYAYTFHATLPLVKELQAGGFPALQGWGGGVIEDFLTRKRIFSVFGWPNLFAGFLLLIIPIAVGFSLRATRVPVRIGWAASAGLLAACLMFTLSLGGWMAAILTGAIAWWLIRRSPGTSRAPQSSRRHPFLRVVALGLGLCGLIFATSFIVAKRARPLIAASTRSRVVYVLGAIEVINAHPLTGTGLGTFGLAYASLMPAPYRGGQHTALHAHNTFFELGAELGLVGLACLLAFLWPIGRLVVVASQRPTPSTLRPLQRGIALGVAGFFLHSLLEQTFFEAVTAPFWWMAVGLLTGAVALGRAGQTPPTDRGGSMRSVAVTGLPLAIACLGLALLPRLVSADLWAARAALLDLSGHPQEAQQAFEQAQRADPWTSRYPVEQAERLLWHAKQRVLGDSGPLLHRARERLQHAVLLSPWLGYAWLQMGLVSEQLGQVDQAIDALRQAAARDPSSAVARAHLTRLLHRTGRFRDVSAIARQWQTLEPNEPAAWFLEALAWHRLGKTKEAVLGYQALVRRFPAYPPGWFNLAELLRGMGDLAGAAEAYDGFLRTAPPSSAEARGVARDFLRTWSAGEQRE